MQQAAVQLSRQSPGGSERGLLVIKSNDELEQERIAENEARERQNQPFITGLAGTIKSHWETARFARNTIEERIIDSLRRRNGEYAPDKLAAIRDQGGSEIYMMLTSIKCRAAEAWINDVLFQPGEKPWKVEPTPVPDLDPETEQVIAEVAQAEAEAWMMEAQQVLPPEAIQERVRQLQDELQKRAEEEAQKIADRMDKRIEDQATEGHFEEALREVIKDVVTYPAACLKGPIIRKRPTLKWLQDPQTGQFSPDIGEELRLEWSRVAPFDLYPSPSSKTVNDGYLFERHRLRRADLVAMKGVEGYDDNAIDLVLTEYGTGGLREWLWRDQERAWLEKRPNEWLNYDDTMDALQFWGSVSGQLLLDWGMDPDKIDSPYAEYQIEAWLIGNYIIRAVLNEDPLGKRPYFKASFEEIPGAFWGYGVPELMADVQDICNAAARSLANNMAISSGPQVEIHTDRLPAGEDIEDIFPWKIWQTESDPHGTNNPALRIHNIPSYAGELLKVYEFFSNLADEYTGIPKYTYGEGGTASGAAGTASGLSMLMSASARGIKQVIKNLDKPIEGTIQRTYIHNMLYDEDQSIKGDLKTEASGSTSLVAKEQQMIRRNEFLMQTNNPIDLGIMGQEGRATLLREAVKSFDIPVDDVVPDRDTIIMRARQAMMQQQEAQQQAQQQPPAPGGPRTIDQAGNPVSGQDIAVFNQGG